MPQRDVPYIVVTQSLGIFVGFFSKRFDGQNNVILASCKELLVVGLIRFSDKVQTHTPLSMMNTLAFLAANGPLEDTVLGHNMTIHFNSMRVKYALQCSLSAWKEHLRAV